MDKMNIRTDKRANQRIKLTCSHSLLTFALAVLLSGCVKDDLYNTPHPDKGAVKVTTDWSGASSDATLPENYVLRIGTEEQTVSGETNAFGTLFLPGKQDLLVYNKPEGITISGTDSGTSSTTTAIVNTLPDGTLEPMPGYLFSAAELLDIVKDDTLRVTVTMQQHIRALTLTLKLKPGEETRIGSTSATLTGIASAISLTDGAITSTEGTNIVPAFVMGTDGGQTKAAGQPILAATLRLLGVITGEKQVLTLKITLTDGYVQTITTDLTEALKNFGGDIKPLELDATLELPVDGNFNGAITGWDKKEDITIDAQ